MRTPFRMIAAITLIVTLLSACSPKVTPTQEEKKLILATTTSTQDSGLLEYLLPDF